MTLIGAAATWPLTWPLAARAQRPDRMRRIGVLMGLGANDPEAKSRAAALEDGLQEAGWIKGRNLRIEYRWADNADVLGSYAAELVGMAPDVALAASTPVTVALKEQHADLPIVFVQVTDPVGAGLAESIARPGGDVTGFALLTPEISSKRRGCLRRPCLRCAGSRCCGTRATLRSRGSVSR